MGTAFPGKICGDNKDPREDPSAPPEGQVCRTPTNPLYSAGVRQQVYLHHAKRPGYKVRLVGRRAGQRAASAAGALHTGGSGAARGVAVHGAGVTPPGRPGLRQQPREA